MNVTRVDFEYYEAVYRDHTGIRVREVRKSFSGAVAALNWLGGAPHVSGPNGPLTDKKLVLSGEEVGAWEAAERLGFRVLVRPYLLSGREVFAGVLVPGQTPAEEPEVDPDGWSEDAQDAQEDTP